MAVIRKTVSISEDLYKEAIAEDKNFSKIVKEALEEYLKKKRKKKLMLLHGVLKNWEIEDGKEFVDRIREEGLKIQEEREKWLDI